MSGVYPYCVVSAGCHPPSGVVGLGDRPVEGHEIGPFTVWTSAQDGPPQLDVEGISRHDAVVRAASTLMTPLPIRFGDWARDHSVLATRIRQRQGELEAALAAVAGCSEFGVTVEDALATEQAGEGGEVPADGRAYMRKLSRVYAIRSQRKERRDAVLGRLRAELADLALDERVRHLPAPGLFAVAHLVARRHEARYRGLVAAFACEHASGIRGHVTGPWPPYSFASS